MEKFNNENNRSNDTKAVANHNNNPAIPSASLSAPPYRFDSDKKNQVKNSSNMTVVEQKNESIPISSETSKAEKEATQLQSSDQISSRVQSDQNLSISPRSKAAIKSGQGNSESLPTAVRETLQVHSDQDLSQINIRNTQEDHALCEELNADAFTYGNDIYFAKGKYNPESKEGIDLLKHEIVHTNQQNGSEPIVQRRMSISRRSVAPEREPRYILREGDMEIELTHGEFGRFILSLNRLLMRRTNDQIDHMRAYYEVTHLGHNVNAYLGDQDQEDSMLSIIASFLSDARGGSDIPLDAMTRAHQCIQRSLQAYQEGDYETAFNCIVEWNDAYEEGIREWNNYLASSNEGAQRNADDLQFVSDVSLKVSIGYFLRGVEGPLGGALTGATVTGIQEVSGAAGELLDSGQINRNFGDAFSNIVRSAILDGVGGIAGEAVGSLMRGMLGRLLLRHRAGALISALRQGGIHLNYQQIVDFIESGAWNSVVEGISGDLLTTPFNLVMSEIQSNNPDAENLDMEHIKDALVDQLLSSTFVSLIGARISN